MLIRNRWTACGSGGGGGITGDDGADRVESDLSFIKCVVLTIAFSVSPTKTSFSVRCPESGGVREPGDHAMKTMTTSVTNRRTSHRPR